jgi:hypothetical protein
MQFILFLILLFGPSAKASPTLSAGMGIGATIANDVNPDLKKTSGLGALYSSIAFRPWSLLWDFSWSQSRVQTGNYSVSDVSYTSSVWGRYEPWTLSHFSPFASVGVGYGIDRVNTGFGVAHDERWTDGGASVGLGGGIMARLIEHWDLEGEMRVLKFELQTGAVYEFALRTGYTF